MCYYDESPEGADPEKGPLPILLCIHGLGQSKEMWLEPEPIPNVRVIAIDRMGYRRCLSVQNL